jgi:hypothetical protein
LFCIGCPRWLWQKDPINQSYQIQSEIAHRTRRRAAQRCGFLLTNLKHNLFRRRTLLPG